MDKKVKNVLFSSVLFDKLSEQDLKIIEEKIEIEISDFKIGEKIDYKSRIGIVISGELRVYSNSGKAFINILLPKSVFGVSTLFSEEGEVTKIEAYKNSRIAFISDDNFQSLLEIKAFRNHFIYFLTGRIRFLNSKINTFSQISAERKVALFLIENEKDGKIIPDVSYGAISDSLGIGRASLYRILSEFENQNIIEKTLKEIIIINKEKLIEKVN